MAIHSVSVDVYCESATHGTPMYRVYVDNDLLTERTWIWPVYENYIKEYIEVDIDPGEHQVKIVSCGGESKFKCRNLTVDNEIVAPGVVNDMLFTTR